MFPTIRIFLGKPPKLFGFGVPTISGKAFFASAANALWTKLPETAMEDAIVNKFRRLISLDSFVMESAEFDDGVESGD